MSDMLNVAVILCAVLLVNAAAVANVSRSKRQDQWVWGPADYNRQSSSIQSGNPSSAEDDPDVCTPLAATVPDFRKPGRRISEIKCYEYIWQMKYRDEKAKKDKACVAYNRRKHGFTFSILVIGGREALSGEFPHMAAIGWKAIEGTWVFKCGGALISPNFVLTAAHCSRASRDTSVADAEPKIVRLGDKNILDVPKNGVVPHDKNIVRIFVHPDYMPPKKYNDIALLRLGGNVEFSKLIQPACLWQSDTRDLRKATITGWGVVQAGATETSPTLQAAEVEIVESATCNRLLRRWCNRLWCGLHGSQLCAGRLAGGVDSCQGDSGSPLQVKIPVPPALGSMHSVVGVTSFGFGCARADAPGVYTRVASYIDWIESVVWS